MGYRKLIIQTEVRVADILKMYQTHATSFHLCYNIAKILADMLIAHKKWEEYKQHMARALTAQSLEEVELTGFLYYHFIDHHMNGDQFEKLVIAQMQIAMKEYCPQVTPKWVAGAACVNFVADQLDMGYRDFRENLLKHILQKDPDAVFVIEC